MWCATKRIQQLLDIPPIQLSGALINPLSMVRDIRVPIANDVGARHLTLRSVMLPASPNEEMMLCSTA